MNRATRDEGFVAGEAFEEWLYKENVFIELADDSIATGTDMSLF